MRRVILAGLLGGLALFAWESVAHLLLPLGQAGIKTIDNEQAVVASLRDNVKQSGPIFLSSSGGDRNSTSWRSDWNPSVPTGGHHEHDAQSAVDAVGRRHRGDDYCWNSVGPGRRVSRIREARSVFHVNGHSASTTHRSLILELVCVSNGLHGSAVHCEHRRLLLGRIGAGQDHSDSARGAH